MLNVCVNNLYFSLVLGIVDPDRRSKPGSRSNKDRDPEKNGLTIMRFMFDLSCWIAIRFFSDRDPTPRSRSEIILDRDRDPIANSNTTNSKWENGFITHELI